MNIEIIVGNNKVKLLLKKEASVLDMISWEEDRDLSQKLLVKLDNLIKKNKLNRSDIKKVEVKTDISEKFTTVRIAKVVANTFNYVNRG